MRAILDAEAMDEASPFASDAPTPDDNVDLLLNDFASIDLEDVVPSPVQIFRLWQVFLERVNPLSKLVHVPTLQPIVVEAAANHRNVANNIQALLFSIYLISTITMSETESRQMLDMSRNEAIKKFTIGVKSALTRVNFLKNYDMTTLQALVLYLVSQHMLVALPDSNNSPSADFPPGSIQPTRGLGPQRGSYPHRSQNGPSP